jgi:hypothetical protein
MRAGWILLSCGTIGQPHGIPEFAVLALVLSFQATRGIQKLLISLTKCQVTGTTEHNV